MYRRDTKQLECNPTTCIANCGKVQIIFLNFDGNGNSNVLFSNNAKAAGYYSK